MPALVLRQICNTVLDRFGGMIDLYRLFMKEYLARVRFDESKDRFSKFDPPRSKKARHANDLAILDRQVNVVDSGCMRPESSKFEYCVALFNRPFWKHH